jgi:hypothetical protein
VLDRVEMANLYQIKSLYFSCVRMIRRNLNTMEKEAKWLELKKKAPELAFSILEEFAEERGNSNGQQNPNISIPLPPTNGDRKCYYCGAYGHFTWECSILN